MLEALLGQVPLASEEIPIAYFGAFQTGGARAAEKARSFQALRTGAVAAPGSGRGCEGGQREQHHGGKQSLEHHFLPCCLVHPENAGCRSRESQGDYSGGSCASRC